MIYNKLKRVFYIPEMKAKINQVYQKRRQTSKIQTKNQSRAIGHRNETKELNTNIKTINMNIFKEAILTRQLGEYETKIIKKYAKMRGSFISLKYLMYGFD